MLQYSGETISVRQAISDGAVFYRDQTIRNLRQTDNDDGTITLTARAVDAFHFVMRPSVTVDPDTKTVVSCTCDCRRPGLCRHAVALLLSIGEEIECVPAAITEPLVPAVPANGQITVRVIHSRQGEPVSPARGEAAPSDPAVIETASAVPDQLPEEPEQSTPEEAAPVAAPEAPEEEAEFVPPGIRIRLGSRLIDDEPVLWTPNDTTQVLHPNMGIIGTMGTGKTQFIKSLICQLVREQKMNFAGDTVGVLIFDYKGDYNETKADFVGATGARVYKPYRLPFNPLAIVEPRIPKPLLPIHVANTFKDTLSRIYHLGPKQQQFLLDCIRSAYAARGIDPEKPETWKKRAPTLANVHQIFTAATADKAPDSLAAAINKLQEFRIFEDSPISVGSLRDLLGSVTVIDLSGYDSDIQNLVVAITLDQFYAQMMTLGSSRTDGTHRELRQLVLVDEADNFMKEDFPSLRKIMKEGREFGVGTVLSTQSLSHFIGGSDDYSRYILTWVVHALGDLKKKDVEYIFRLPPKSIRTEDVYAAVKGLEKHRSVLKIANNPPEVIRDLAFWQIMQAQ